MKDKIIKILKEEYSYRTKINDYSSYKLLVNTIATRITSLYSDEISDEEIKKEATELWGKFNSSRKIMWIEGAKWMRDKLNNK